MASITQTIPNYFGGISQVPDSQKGQGQVNYALNVIPDLNRGLMKRPGSARISPTSQSLVGATQDGTWFHYYRDEEEGSYIGQIQTDGTVNIWDAETGAAQTVTPPSSAVQDYLAKDRTPDRCLNSNGVLDTTLPGCANQSVIPRGNEDLQFTTIADTTFVCNRNVTVAWDSQLTDNYLADYTAFVEVKKIESGRQYGLNVHNPTNNNTTTITTATRLSVSPNFTEGFTTYSGEEGHCPYVGTKIFKKALGANKDNLILRLTVTGQQGPVPGKTTNADLDKANDYTCKYTATVDLLHGGEGWVTGNSVDVTLEGKSYEIEIEDHEEVQVRASRRAVRPRPTPFDQATNVSVDTILGGIQDGVTNNSSALGAEAIGNGLYIYPNDGTSPFTIEAQNTDLLTVINREVNSIAELPYQCKDGFIVKVVNSNVAEDDYYLRFEGIDGDGPGTWVECAKPGINKRLDRSTMPIVIRRKESPTGAIFFTVEEYEYPDREVGDDEYDPSFIGEKINKVIHFRNRLGFLADSNVVLSRPGDIGNFFINTALTVSGTDPIDISSSSQYPGKLYDAIEINTGLLVFGEKQQFLLATDSDILNPETARLSNIASYNYNKNIPPFSLGTVAGFVDNAGAKSRFFVMSNVAREGEPNVNEFSKPVPKLLPKDIDLVSNSRENSIVLFAKKNDKGHYVSTTRVQVYKYFNVADRQVQSSWAEWEIQLGVNYMCAIGNSVYIVNSDLYLTKLNLIEDDSDPKIHDINLGTAANSAYEGDYPVHLDNYVCLDGLNNEVLLPGTTYTVATYNADTDKTSFDLTNLQGFSGVHGATNVFGTLYYSESVTVVHLDSGAYKEVDFRETALGSTAHSRIFELDGNYTTGKIVIGAPFYTNIELPRFFVQDVKGDRTINETRGNLVLHRAKLTFDEVSRFEVDIWRQGTDDLHLRKYFEASQYGSYFLGNSTIDGVDWYEGRTFTATVPIYLNSNDMYFELTSSDPFPCTLISLTWEGDYSPKYYKNV
jgi:hypothetical protein